MRLIDADDIHFYWEGGRKNGKTIFAEAFEKIFNELIQKAPTVDAEPVRHGRWIYDFNEDGYDGYRCSNCMEHRQIDYKDDYHYCPNCGAKMDVKEKEE